MGLEASHLVITCVLALQVCMVIVVVYLCLGYSVQSGWAMTCSIYVQQVAHQGFSVTLGLQTQLFLKKLFEPYDFDQIFTNK